MRRPRATRNWRVALTILSLAGALTAGAPAPQAADDAGAGGETAQTRGSGLPVPRFVSLKADQVNLRAGPGRDYPTAWVYKRAGLPLEIVKEFDVWREVRDADGTQGWIIQSLLSSRRTALILPWELKKGEKPPQAALHKTGSESAAAVAMVEAGVIADILSCDGDWCRVTVDRFRGYIEQNKLWGVYQGERVN